MIFGNSKSYIISGVTMITLNHSVTGFGLFSNRDIEYKSIINGKKTHTLLGDYSDFNVLVWLWKESSPSTKLNTLVSLVGSEVTFLLEGATQFVKCWVESVRPFYHKNLRNYDACRLHLFPTVLTSISNYILDESGIPIEDEDGNKIKSEGFQIA